MSRHKKKFLKRSQSQDLCCDVLLYFSLLQSLSFSFFLQRNFSMSVNSVAVLRLMGKGGGAIPASMARGRGSVRGGRGERISENLDY